MKISVSELRAITNKLFDHLESTGNHEIELDKDYYWSIPDERLYLPYEEPREHTLGQLSDDWNELKRFTSGTDPIAYGLVWLSSILRFIGSKFVA